MNYIGSKQSIIEFIESSILKVVDYKNYNNIIFADLFAGTGVVGKKFRKRGFKVIANDIQYYSYVIIYHLIVNKEPLRLDLFEKFNSLPGVEGYIYNNYCPGSGSNRNYFTDENGKKCDAIREELERMYKDKKIDTGNYYFYLGSLINSIDKVANTASVYGAFLKKFKKSALKTLVLEPLEIVEGISGVVYNDDINKIIKNIKGDILYLDPPYNARQYSANYHILETIARNDKPEITGITGLRPAGDQASAFCSKRLVEQEFEYLVQNADFKYIFLSYNNEGLMSLETIKSIMEKYGEYSFYTREHRRFKADKEENRNIKASKTLEFLHCLIKKEQDE